MRQHMQLTFVNLMDEGSATIKSYGLLNEQHGHIPHPAALIIDREGIIRYLRVDEKYTERPSNDELLEALAALPNE